MRGTTHRELLVILGILSVCAGLALTLFLGSLGRIHDGVPNIAPAFVLLAVAIALIVGGVWLARGRRWGGMLVAAASFGVGLAYLAMLTRCSDCTLGVLAANIAVAVLFALPGVAIVRWRRFLR